MKTPMKLVIVAGVAVAVVGAVALKKGTNELFAKVVNGGGPWDLRVSVLTISPPR